MVRGLVGTLVAIALVGTCVLIAAETPGAPQPAVAAPVAAPAAQATEQTVETPVSQEEATKLLGDCVWGFSKDICAGELRGGRWSVVTCGRCVTLIGRSVEWKFRFQANPESCCPTVDTPCDDARTLDSTFLAVMDVQIRLNDPCKFRGSYTGKFELYDAVVPTIQPFAYGTINGTLGVGTHRPPRCIYPTIMMCGDKCETCYAVEPDPSQLPPAFYFVHTEGLLKTTEILDGPYAGCELTSSLQGFFKMPMGNTGLPVWPSMQVWPFCGTADGVVACRCLTDEP